MKIRYKIIITAVSLVLFIMVLSWMAVKFADGWAVTGLWFFAFFAVNPLLTISLSIMVVTQFCKLWWIPLVIAALFPLLFGVAIGEFVWDLYVYSAIYPSDSLQCSVLILVKRWFRKRKVTIAYEKR